MLYLKLLSESILFAIHALVANKLRTFLSLLGITIGIFAIISVFTMVDSLEKKIRDSVSSLGDNVIFVQKWPWTFGADYPWWKYWQRPVPSVKEMQEIQRRGTIIQAATFLASVNKTISFENNSIENVEVLAVSQDYNKVKSFELQNGRYFSENESASGKNIAIIGNTVAENLFLNTNPIGKSIKIAGNKCMVVGVFSKEGESMFGNSMDNQVIVPVTFGRSFIDVKDESTNPFIMVKAINEVSNDQLKDELTGIMRSLRKLKPKVEDDFALNETSLISNGFDQLFTMVNFAGGIIGFFSIIVGGFGIANIMFVSVKERTNIIGIQKSLGAKNSFILFQFLAEAVILCLIGGIAGLAIIFSGTIFFNLLLDMEIALTIKNIIIGLGISASIGLISGIIPAYFASRMDPVEAIRSN
ncbi:MAG: ABC transporter permease [Bacteroidetes bacterium]|nr:ABC transporter permease [Bacteroidota bacterium]HET6243473.1 ABC transporter permease [Bacteroidia bacterium]